MNFYDLKVEDLEGGSKRIYAMVASAEIEPFVEAVASYAAAEQRLEVDASKQGDLRSVVHEVGGSLERHANEALLEIMLPPLFTKLGIVPAFVRSVDYAQSALDDSVDSFAFWCVVLPKPAYTLSNYGPIEVSDYKVGTAEKRSLVARRKDLIRDHFAEYTPLPGATLEENDLAYVDLRVKCNGVKLEDLTGKNKLIHLIRGNLPDEFLDGIIGLRRGHTAEFDVVKPKPFTENGLAEDVYHCVVTFRHKVERSCPDLDDEAFLRNAMHFSSRESFQLKVKEDVEERIARERGKELDAQINEELASRLVGDVPEELYELTHNNTIQALADNMQAKGLSFDKYLQDNDYSSTQLSVDMMYKARRDVRASFALDAIADYLGISMTRESCLAFLLDKGYAETPEEADDLFGRLERRGSLYELEEAFKRLRAREWVKENTIIR